MEPAPKSITGKIILHALLFLIVFTAGGFAGYAISTHKQPDGRFGRRYREDPGKFEHEMADRISQRYNLSPEARENVREAIKRNGEKLRTLNSEFEPRFQECFKELSSAIRSQIPQDMLNQYDEDLKNLRSRMPFERHKQGADDKRHEQRDGHGPREDAPQMRNENAPKEGAHMRGNRDVSENSPMYAEKRVQRYNNVESGYFHKPQARMQWAQRSGRQMQRGDFRRSGYGNNEFHADRTQMWRPMRSERQETRDQCEEMRGPRHGEGQWQRGEREFRHHRMMQRGERPEMRGQREKINCPMGSQREDMRGPRHGEGQWQRGEREFRHHRMMQRGERLEMRGQREKMNCPMRSQREDVRGPRHGEGQWQGGEREFRHHRMMQKKKAQNISDNEDKKMEAAKAVAPKKTKHDKAAIRRQAHLKNQLRKLVPADKQAELESLLRELETAKQPAKSSAAPSAQQETPKKHDDNVQRNQEQQPRVRIRCRVLEDDRDEQ